MRSSTEEEVGITSPFGGSKDSEDRELVIVEGVSAGSSVPNFRFDPDSNVVVMEGEESMRRALEDVEARDGRAEEASEGDSFVDIMSSLEKETGRESERFTFEDILQHAGFLSETVLEGLLDTPELSLC